MPSHTYMLLPFMLIPLIFILTPINHTFYETVYKISYFAPASPIKEEIDFHKPHHGLDHIEKLGTPLLHTDSECEN